MFSWITRKDDFEKEKYDKDMEHVRELYFNNGYINAKLDEPRIDLYEDKGFFGAKKRMKLTIPVEEGKQYNTGEITFEGNTVFTDEQMRPLMELEKGKVFNRGQMKKGLEAIQKLYGDQGYIYASLGPVFNPKEDSAVIDVPIQVEENGQFFINRIEFTGNNYTRDKVIRREMLLQEGDLLRVTRFRDSIDRIYRLGFFDDLKPNILPTEGKDNRADITVDVKENKRNEIRVGGGYSEFEGFFGNIVFSTKNLFGTGKIFTINVQSGSRYDNYGLEILEPYFLDRPLSLGFSLYKARSDYTYSSIYNYIQETTGGSLTSGFHIYHDFKGLVTYAYQVVNITRPSGVTAGNDQIDDIFPGYNLQQNDRTESRLIPQLLRSTINNPTDPSRGTRFVFSHVITGGFLGGEVSYYKPSVVWTQYLRGLSKKHYFAYNIEAAYATGFGGQLLPYYERYFLGGERSIRGYDVKFVAPVRINPLNNQPFIAGGNKSFVANVEYVIPVGGPLKFAAFLDYGNAFLENESIDFTDMRGSTGLELRFLAPFLSTPFRFIYAINFNRGELMSLPEVYRPQKSVFRFSVGTTF
jgi:outer membrane protein insertion porin family